MHARGAGAKAQLFSGRAALAGRPGLSRRTLRQRGEWTVGRICWGMLPGWFSQMEPSLRPWSFHMSLGEGVMEARDECAPLPSCDCQKLRQFLLGLCWLAPRFGQYESDNKSLSRASPSVRRSVATIRLAP